MHIWDRYQRKTGLVIVLSGPSGVGKDAVLEEFVRVCPDVTRCITTTTRSPRPSEQPGKDYNFICEDEFKQMIEAGQFLEHAHVHCNLYGTPRKWVEEQTAMGRDVVLKIDVQGGIAVKKQLPNAIMVFLVPPSLDELERRLRSRMTETEHEITKRLLDARSELGAISSYEYIVENDTIESAATKLRAIVIAERSRIMHSS